MKIETYDLPDFWAACLINGDESGMTERDMKALNAFVQEMQQTYGHCSCLTCSDDDGGDFRRYHDATRFGVLACNVLTYSFDVTPR